MIREILVIDSNKYFFSDIILNYNFCVGIQFFGFHPKGAPSNSGTSLVRLFRWSTITTCVQLHALHPFDTFNL